MVVQCWVPRPEYALISAHGMRTSLRPSIPHGLRNRIRWPRLIQSTIAVKVALFRATYVLCTVRSEYLFIAPFSERIIELQNLFKAYFEHWFSVPTSSWHRIDVARLLASLVLLIWWWSLRYEENERHWKLDWYIASRIRSSCNQMGAFWRTRHRT